MACKSGHDMRAFELCKLIKSEQSLNLALKYAVRIGNNSLAEKITEIIEKETNEDDESPEPIRIVQKKSKLFNETLTSSK